MVVKRHQGESLEPRYDGPFQVLLTSATFVKLEGSQHASTLSIANLLILLASWSLLTDCMLRDTPTMTITVSIGVTRMPPG
ncbi:hypothetical protein GDO81_027041 [Engystomops pustulosus]|uniref:Murine leukemia virus integrase C-terminal domain-containing protein n=1 Tax=Engystomops pustulosus TaxID=76066 RepID=A0AAV6ZS30_ENGPU|nr:hypothetical protein GDO81_027041 [Engystomops pustulosus]